MLRIGRTLSAQARRAGHGAGGCRIAAMANPGVADVLDTLERYARAFDELSKEQDAHYSARSFVRWLRLETTVVRDRDTTEGASARAA